MRIVGKAALAAKRALLHDGRKQFLGFRRRRDIDWHFRRFVRDTAIARIVRNGLHYVLSLDAANLPGGDAHNRRNGQFGGNARFQFRVAGLVLVGIVYLGLLLLHLKQTRRIEIHQNRLRLLVELDHVFATVRKGRFHLRHKLVLQTENRLIVFLRGRRVLEVEHRVPFGDGRAGQHAVHGERQGLLALLLASANRLLDFLDIRVLGRHVVPGDVDDLILGKVLEGSLLALAGNQRGKRVARGAIGEHADQVTAHHAVLDLVVVKESQQLVVFLAAVNHLEEFAYLLLELEPPVAAVHLRCDAFGREERRERVCRPALAQCLKPHAGGSAWMEGKADHLREAEIRIVPFAVLIVKYVFVVPPLLFVGNVGERTERDDVLLVKLTAHQDSVRRSRKVKRHVHLERLDGRVHVLGVLAVLAILAGRLVRHVALRLAKDLSVFAGTRAVMGLIYNQEVDLPVEQVPMPLLDRGGLQILKREEYDDLLSRAPQTRNNLVVRLEVFTGKEFIVVSEVLGTLDGLLPFAADICLRGQDKNDVRPVAVVHCLGAAHGRKRLAEAHDGVHEQVFPAGRKSSLKSPYGGVLVGAQRPHAR